MAMDSSLLLVLVCAVLASVVEAESSHNLTRSKRAVEKCFDDLGCFETGGDFFHPIYRPINAFPEDREKIDVRFNLFTRRNAKQAHRLKAKNEASVLKGPFDPTKDTKVILHGWIDNQLFGPWMGKMKDAFLLNEDDNVIIVDWSGGNSLPYTQATANTRLVGAELALLIKYIQDLLKYSPSKIHILGHSLGAHVAGYVGERIKGLGRISAMDPAEPYFQNMPPSVRIDPTDADFVDVIHTDSLSIMKLGLGMAQLVGHVDFFPNNGYKQPGCSTDRFTSIFTDGLFEGARRFVACDHQRAVDFMTESIFKDGCEFVSVACADWDAFTQGRCNDCGPLGEKCAVMGMNADKYREVYKKSLNDGRKQMKFFTKTDKKNPFCLYQYQISIKLENNLGRDEDGEMEITLQGESSSSILSLGNRAERLHPGATYTFLVTTSKKVGLIKAVTFKWNSNFVLLRKPVLYVKSIQIVPLTISDHSERKSATKIFCANPVKGIKPKESAIFNKIC